MDRRLGLLLAAGALILCSAAAVRSIQKPGPEPPSGTESSSREEPGGWDGTVQTTGEEMTLLFCGVDDTGLLTDVILLGRYEPADRRLRVLQIPRDTYIGGEGTGKINGIYGHPPKKGEGLETLKGLLEDQLALTIDHSLAITLRGVRRAVDAIGGVPVEVPVRMEYLPGKVLEPGLQLLDGQRAEWFLRYRSGYAMGDLGRIRAQELFLRAAADRLQEIGRARTLGALAACYPEAETDLSPGMALRLADGFFTGGMPETEIFLLPGRGAHHKQYAVYEIDREAAAELLNEEFRPKAAPVPPEALPVRKVPLPPMIPARAQENIKEETTRDNTGIDPGSRQGAG